jgi:hypothetical protein
MVPRQEIERSNRFYTTYRLSLWRPALNAHKTHQTTVKVIHLATKLTLQPTPISKDLSQAESRLAFQETPSFIES